MGERYGRWFCRKIYVAIREGRTHQIRVHMAYIGHPVSGDKVYGVKNEKVDFISAPAYPFRQLRS